ncbi:SRPBCC family protein [soil metagenome]
MTTARSIRQSQQSSRELWRGSGAKHQINVGETEQLVSQVGGGVLLFAGLLKGGIKGLALSGLGAALVYRGLTGHCSLYQALGADTSEGSRGPFGSVGAQRGTRVEEAIIINRPAEEIYQYWRDHSNLPRFMGDIQSVTSADGQRSHWIYQGPMGLTLEWDAEIHTDEPGRMIGWRSLPGAEVDTAGSVHFIPRPSGRGTEVRVNQKFDPPGGKISLGLARLIGADPATQTRNNLQRLKQIMEGSDVPTA